MSMLKWAPSRPCFTYPFSLSVVQDLSFLRSGYRLYEYAFMTIIVSFFIFVLSEQLNHYLMKKLET
jgi:hypothetical protein